MKRRHPLTGLRAIACLLLACTLNCAHAAKFTRAEVTKVVNDVKLLSGTKTSKPASRGSVVSGSTAVRTGQKSRSELQFPDRSIVRLGSNSVFSFLNGKREVELEKGTLLMQVPKSLGRTRVKTAAISAAITGTTILIEYIPPVSDKAGTVKIIVIEGSLQFSLNNNPRVKVKLNAGEMVAFRTDTQKRPDVLKFDIPRLVETSLLVDGGMGELPFLRPIETEVIAQNDEKRFGRLLGRNDRRQPRGRIFSRILTGRNIDRARTAINGRPSTPATRPATAVGGGNNNGGGGGGGGTAPPATGGGGVQLPARPDRTPPGNGGSNNNRN